MTRAALLLALACTMLAGPGCMTWCNNVEHDDYLRMLACVPAYVVQNALKPVPEKPPTPPAYVVTAGKSECVSAAVPATLRFEITNKATGSPEREEVLAWAYTEGGDWHGGNAIPGSETFTASFRDYDRDKAKLKVYDRHAVHVPREPFLAMPWAPDETYIIRAEILPGKVIWSAQRKSDGFSPPPAVVEVDTPDRTTICIGDPGSRKAALGSRISGVERTGAP